MKPNTTPTDYRLTDLAMVIAVPALPRPTRAQIQEQFPDIHIQEIACDDSPEAAVTLRLATVLAPDEPIIDGGTYDQRTLPLRPQGILLGLQQIAFLVRRQDEYPPLKNYRGPAFYVDGIGLVARDKDGHRLVPCMYGGSGIRWKQDWHCFDL